MTVVLIIEDAVLFALAAWFLAYGVKAGFIDRRILAKRGIYKEGRAALVQGGWYVLVGALLLVSALIGARSLLAA